MYASNWRVTAELQYKRGDYAWMAQQRGPYQVRRILDVGCGSGHGILSMLEELGPDLRIVALDENPFCLAMAREALRAAKRGNAEVIRRVSTVPYHGRFRSAAEPFNAPLPHPLTLVETDVCSDPYLQTALNEDGPFDAVTVWLSGAHMFRQFNETVVGAGVEDDTTHRLFVQNSVYELADKVLRPGGVLQVVDRGEAPTSDLLKSDIIRSHSEQAGPTSLKVRTLDYTPWSPLQTSRVPMVYKKATSGRLPGKETAVYSVISVKT